ncbi:hypothetical protein M153_1570001721 [Pseudoloma neurophilia]|uniref:Uncharacterized protein n=1 Tax=Pseudoloma neurophilia TaxID=146866 RepID=A0A0R0LZK9_9MICR|nr:hypothetical protein M153_1570001721 [Pseudoloma neurophilia]
MMGILEKQKKTLKKSANCEMRQIYRKFYKKNTKTEISLETKKYF